MTYMGLPGQKTHLTKKNITFVLSAAVNLHLNPKKCEHPQEKKKKKNFVY